MEALYPFNILAFMSQENEYNESEVIEDDIIDEVEDNDEDFGEEEDGDESNDSDTIADLREKLAKAERAIVKSKKSGTKTSKPQKTSSKLDSQVDLLRFNGVTSDEIEKLKKIAVMEDIDLIDARNSEYFTIWKDKQEKEAQSKQATVGASKRGRTVTENLDQVRKRIMEGKGSAEDLKRVRDSK